MSIGYVAIKEMQAKKTAIKPVEKVTKPAKTTKKSSKKEVIVD